MNIISIDLGTTNIKAAIYNCSLSLITLLSESVTYDRDNDFVEFDANEYFNKIISMIRHASAEGKKFNNEEVGEIILTGQAESLIVLGENNEPIYPGISWLDMRSKEECKELSQHFDSDECFHTTGQPELIPTWPITKLLWLKKNEPPTFEKAVKYLLLKDYIVYRLCENMLGDYTIYSFSHYFNISKKCYWKEILDYCGVRLDQLPPVAPSGSIAGHLIAAHVDENIGLTRHTKINIGTLDHFAGMIGTGNTAPGMISESAGTVLSISTLVDAPLFGKNKIPIYCGPFPETYVLLPVCESGGFSMEWYKNNFFSDISYDVINRELEKCDKVTAPIFLPYLTGVNAPDFNENASGVFFGLKAHHTKYDLALSVMQGVACLLKKNLDIMKQEGIFPSRIISTGGGAKSPLWTQIKADITECIVDIPENEEAPCLGAAIISAISLDYFGTYEEALAKSIRIQKTYHPLKTTFNTYDIFEKLYSSLTDVFAYHTARERAATLSSNSINAASSINSPV